MFDCIVNLLVGVAVFLTSMRLMSDGLRKLSGKSIKNLFNKTRDNKIVSFLIGLSSTAIIQSSDATALMVIGFVSAGAMSLFQAIATILGAYVGTTVTGVIVSFSSFSFSKYLTLLSFIGVVMIFFKKEKIHNIGKILCGLGLLFFGLSTMSLSFGTKENPSQLFDVFSKLFSNIENVAISPLIFYIFGAILSALLQSSSAASGLIIVMVGQNTISLSSGLFLILGATLGTVTNTLIATIGSDANAKRTSFACLFIKLATSLFGLAIVWPLNNAISSFLINTFKSNQFAVSMFLVIFSALTMLALLPLTKYITNLVTKLIIDKKQDKNTKAIKYIDDKLINTPEIAMMQAKREIINMLSYSYRNYVSAYQILFTQNFENKEEIIDTEDILDYLNKRLTSYLILLTSKASNDDEKTIGSYFHIINDIERIGDHAYNFYEMSKDMKDKDLVFSSIAQKELDEMYKVVNKMFDLSKEIFINKDYNSLSKLHELENTTDELKLRLSDLHFTRISNKQCKVELSPYYSSLVSELERVADHLVNIGYAIVNPVGDAD